MSGARRGRALLAIAGGAAAGGWVVFSLLAQTAWITVQTSPSGFATRSDAVWRLSARVYGFHPADVVSVEPASEAVTILGPSSIEGVRVGGVASFVAAVRDDAGDCAISASIAGPTRTRLLHVPLRIGVYR